MKKKEKHFAKSVLEDQKLIKNCLNNDQQSYNTLMKKYKASVYHLALRLVKNESDAEDLVSQTFSKAFLKLSSFNLDYIFSSWLFKITTNTAIDLLRKKKIPLVSLSHSDKVEEGKEKKYPYIINSIADDKLNFLDETIQLEENKHIKVLVDSLPEKYRSIIIMRYYKNMSYKDIASDLSIPLGTAKAHIYRAKDILFTLMKRKT